jgi:hypothetical protein
MLSGDFAGVWWLPANPDKTWGGFLHLADGQQPQLHVAGLMTELTKRFAAIIEHPVIHGITADGKLVTLFGGTETGGQMQLFSEVGETMVTAPRAYVGNHFASEAAAGFRRISLRLTYLDAWFPAPWIERQIDLDSKGRLRRGVLTFEPGKGAKVKLPFGTLSFDHDFSASGDQRRDAHFAQTAWIVATTDRRQPLSWWETTVVKPLRHLISLSTELPVWVEDIRLRPWVTKTDDEVEVVWANDRIPEVREDPHQARMLLWFGDLADRLDAALGDWFAVVDEIPQVLDQFFGTYNTARSFAQTRFTMTASAAEAYHRERIGGRDAPPDVHKKRMRQAREGVDKEFRKWLDERLGRNEPTFQRRIKELCESVPEVAKLIVGDDLEAFAKPVREARNLRTHLGAGGKKATHNIVQMQAQLAVILEAALLQRELGVDGSYVAKRIKEASRFRHIAIRAGEKL